MLLVLTFVYIIALIISGIVGVVMFGWVGKLFAGYDAAREGWDEPPFGSSAEWNAELWRDEADLLDDANAPRAKK